MNHNTKLMYLSENNFICFSFNNKNKLCQFRNIFIFTKIEILIIKSQKVKILLMIFTIMEKNYKK